jgi:hypothetical protein
MEFNLLRAGFALTGLDYSGVAIDSQGVALGWPV